MRAIGALAVGGAVLTACAAGPDRRASTPPTAKHSAAVATVPLVDEPDNSTPPPPIDATGSDYVAIARSLVAYRDWLVAHHPDPALASEIYVRGTTTYEQAAADLGRLRAQAPKRVEVARLLTFAVASVHGAMATLRMHDADGGDSVVVMTRNAEGRWRLADVTQVTPDAAAGGGRFGGSPPALGVGLLVSVPGAAGRGHDTFSADDPLAPRPVFERAIPAEVGAPGAGALSNLCHTPDGPTGIGFEIANGWVFNLELFATADGRYLATVGIVCQPLDPAARTETPPPPPVVQPPTIGEIWRSAGLPVSTIGVSPEARGITGLPTWVWAGGATAPVAVAASVRGYTITGTARAVGHGVFVGENGWIASRVAGGPGDPALTHTYEKTGTYRLGVATLWTANAVLTGPGIAAPLTIDLGAALVTNGRDYQVVQIRSRLVS